MKRTVESAHRSRSASACARFNGGEAILLRYWMAVAPPAIAPRTRAISSSLSSRLGVSAYSPEMTARMSVPVQVLHALRLVGGRLRLLVARPEQPIGQELSHARPV